MLHACYAQPGTECGYAGTRRVLNAYDGYNTVRKCRSAREHMLCGLQVSTERHCTSSTDVGVWCKFWDRARYCVMRMSMHAPLWSDAPELYFGTSASTQLGCAGTRMY